MEATPKTSAEAPMVASPPQEHGESSMVETEVEFSMLGPNDPDNPMTWSVLKRGFVSFQAYAYAWAVAFGITSYTAGLAEIQQRFHVDMTTALVGFGIMFWGIAFSPIWVPHATERLGRRPVYWASNLLFAVCMLGVGFANNFSTVLAMRFFAGFFGGPPLVLIEGTFADVWSARTTVTYYSYLTLASYMGAACGPLIAGFVVASRGWQWAPWLTLIFAAAAFVLGSMMPETYAREILRRRIRHGYTKKPLSKALSGVTLREMATITVWHPLQMLVSEPLVIMISLYLGLNFAVVFQFFVSVPAVLSMVYGFTVQRAGLAFISAIGGVLLAAFTSTVLDLVSVRGQAMPAIEKRLFPAMIGSFGIIASLFWIGFTASPKVSYLSPIFGTALYVWGNASVLISFISYLFDAYPPAGTLAGLTAAASFRRVCAGIVPIFILQMFTNLTGAWALATFGFISAAMMPFPFIMYLFGPKLRARSRFSDGAMNYMELEMAARDGKTEHVHGEA